MRAICKVVYYFPAHTWCVHQTHNSSLPYFGIFQPSKTKAPLVTPKKSFVITCHMRKQDLPQYDDSIMAFLTKAFAHGPLKACFFSLIQIDAQSPPIESCLFIILLLSFTQFCSFNFVLTHQLKTLPRTNSWITSDGGGLMFSVTKLKLIKPNKKFLKNIGNTMNTYFAWRN